MADITTPLFAAVRANEEIFKTERVHRLTAEVSESYSVSSLTTTLRFIVRGDHVVRARTIKVSTEEWEPFELRELADFMLAMLKRKVKARLIYESRNNDE